MSIQEENLRLKIALISMIEQFYQYTISVENAKKYNIIYENPEGLGYNCYFHMFESTGEKAWTILGFDKPIISVKEMDEIKKQLTKDLLDIVHQCSNVVS
jgi:hypothetical protein